MSAVETPSREKVRPTSQRARGGTFTAVERLLRDRVSSGQWPAGTMIPGRRQLALEHGVALRTVERAISSLLEDGTLRADDRRGTFVARGGDAGVVRVPSGREVTPGHATLGIVGVFAPAAVPLPGVDEYGWVRSIITAAERSWAVQAGPSPGGANSDIITFNRFVMDGAPMIPVSDAILSLRQSGAEAVVVVGIHDAALAADAVASALAAAGETFPLVYISWHALETHLPHLFYDNESAGYQAALHLLQSGYRSLLFLAPFQPEWVALRLKGARQAVSQFGLAETALRLYPGDSPPEDPAQSDVRDRQAIRTREVLADADRGGLFASELNGANVGVIAPNDFVALMLMETAGARGRVAGRDYGLVGFDDEPRSLGMGLTTLRPPLEALGEQAALLLRSALRGDETALQIRLRSHLIPRASSRPLVTAAHPRDWKIS